MDLRGQEVWGVFIWRRQVEGLVSMMMSITLVSLCKHLYGVFNDSFNSSENYPC